MNWILSYGWYYAKASEMGRWGVWWGVTHHFKYRAFFNIANGEAVKTNG